MDIKGAFSGYSTHDVEAARIFYRDTLGLEVEDRMGGIGFSIHGQQIFIYAKDDHQPATFTVLNFLVDDIDTAIDELTTRGVTFEHYENLPAPQDERGVLRGKEAGMGPDIAWFKDPSGNILALIEE